MPLPLSPPPKVTFCTYIVHVSIAKAEKISGGGFMHTEEENYLFKTFHCMMRDKTSKDRRFRGGVYISSRGEAEGTLSPPLFYAHGIWRVSGQF